LASLATWESFKQESAKEEPGMDASVRFDTQIIGALPVIVDYFEQLQLGAIVNEVVPWEGGLLLGTVVEVMIANRLLHPEALYRIGEWSQKAGLTDYYGLTPQQLNDDLLGRALERLAEHGDAIEAAVVTRMLKVFKVRVKQIHFDITDVELYGAYERQLAEGQAPPTPLPAYGRTKSGRKNVKQIGLGLNVTADGGVPVGHLPLDGNAAESPVHLENLRALAKTLGKSDFVYIADTKLDTTDNLLAIAAGDGFFLCGGAFQPHLQDEYLKLRRRGKLKKVDYFPQSQARLPADQRDKYEAAETTAVLKGTVGGRTIHVVYRLVFVWSEAKARQEAQTRERHVSKIREQFEAVERNLNKYSLTTQEKILGRLESAKAKYSEGGLFEYKLTKDRKGIFHLTWKINAKRLARRKQLEGVYVLKTNLPAKRCPTAQALSTYKGQSQVERRFHHCKGPLAVAPMFLEKPERMAGLLCILVWALMVMALMERQTRCSLKGKPMYGLYPENRPSPAPTGPAILRCFSTLCIVIVKEHGQVSRRLAEPDPTQQKLLHLLGIPPDRLRTFKRRCGT
jgi:transposase